MTPAQRAQIIDLLTRTNDLTIATLRPDGFPHATVVSYVSDGLDIYFGCAKDSQKARNLVRNPRVSVTVYEPASDWNKIEGLSLAALASEVTDPDELARFGQLMVEKFPQVSDFVTGDMEDMKIIKLHPVVISILDYRKGFGHTEQVAVEPALAA